MEELSQNNGFALNTKRNTACVFNRKAFVNFLHKSGITHVVRAHEVKQAGFEVGCKYSVTLSVGYFVNFK